jgi:hypothetical protein
MAADMGEHGYKGDPVKVFEHEGEKYVLDGHHRLAAAREANLPTVPFESVPESQLAQYGYGSIEELIWASSEAGGR